MSSTIYELERQVGGIRADRNRYADEIQRIQRVLDNNTSGILRDKNDLEYHLRRQRLQLAGKVLSNAMLKGTDRVARNYFADFMCIMKEDELKI